MTKLMYYGELRELTGCTEETTQAASLRDVLRELGRRHGAAALRAAKRSLMTLDGVRVDRPNSRDSLPAGCTVCFFPLCSGG